MKEMKLRQLSQVIMIQLEGTRFVVSVQTLKYCSLLVLGGWYIAIYGAPKYMRCQLRPPEPT